MNTQQLIVYAIVLAVQVLAFGAAWLVMLLIANPSPLRVRLLRAVGFSIWAVLRLYACTRPRIEIARGTISRWFLTSKPTADVTGPSGWYLHRINDRDYTDEEHFHPWTRARTFVLRGGYDELRSGVPFSRRAGDVATFVPTDFHVTIRALPNTWTLFYAGPKSGKGWGFRSYPGGPIRRAAKGRVAGRKEDERPCPDCGKPVRTDGLDVCWHCVSGGAP